MIDREIPLTPFKSGKIFDTPAESPKEVLERVRLAISPRGAWNPRGLTGKAPGGGQARCLIQLVRDCDGKHAAGAEKLLLAAIKRKGFAYTTIPSFNDATGRAKHQVIDVVEDAVAHA